MATVPNMPKGPSNQAGLGSTPGTQKTASLNVSSGGNLNPNMPAGAQLAKQAASSYQQSLLPSSAPGGAKPTGSGATGAPLPAPTTGATPPVQAPPAKKPAKKPVVTQGAADPTKGYNILAGMSPAEIIEANKALGISNNFQAKGDEELNSLLLMSQEEEEADTSFGIEKPAGEGGAVEDVYTEAAEAYEELAGTVADDSPGPYEAQDYEIGGDGPPTAEVGSTPGFGGLDKPSPPGTVNEYSGVDGDLGGKNVGEIEDAIFQWEVESGSDTIGLDPEKKAAAMANLDQKYAIHLQQLLVGLDRQAAMAGTFGSAAHTMNINTAVSGAMQQMASEFMELEKMDLAAVEEDYSEMFSQMQGVAQQYKDMEAMGMELEKLNQMAYDMGLDKFAQEVQLFLAEGKLAELDLQEYGLDLQAFQMMLQKWGIDIDAYQAGVSAEQIEADLEMQSEKLSQEAEKSIAEMSSMLDQETAGYVASLTDWIKEQYDGFQETAYMQAVYSVFFQAQSQLAAGKDYDEVMTILYDALGDMATEMGAL